MDKTGEYNSTDRQRVAKNTVLLYIRMFVIMIIGLYIGRIILDTLGETDYGIYNVVGGVIAVSSFLLSAISAASQRFISYELGTGNIDRLKMVFCSSVNIHIILAILFLLLGETVGLWFVNTYLNIPAERMTAANWVYQASIFVLICKVMSVPYNSAIIAHERMSAFAYVSILEVLLDLGAIYLLKIVFYDKLVVYALLLSAIALFIRLCYIVYCRLHFKECKYAYTYDKKVVKEMFAYAGWSIFGGIVFTSKDQIVNIILNMFCGPSVNAARGLGVMVSSKVNAFSQNFTTAITPQITKQYAAGNQLESKNLVYMGSRFSLFLLLIVSIPFLLNGDYILGLWLIKVPAFTGRFLQLSLLSSIIYSLSFCLSRAIEATGHVKWFQIGIFVIMMAEIPAAWILLQLGLPPYMVVFPAVISNILTLFFRFFLLRYLLPIYNFKEYVSNVLLRSFVVFGVSYAICKLLCRNGANNLLSFLTTSFLGVLITCIVVYTFGLEKKEKKFLSSRIKMLLMKKTLSDCPNP